MFELHTEVLQGNVTREEVSDLVDLQLALVGGGCGTPALE